MIHIDLFLKPSRLPQSGPLAPRLAASSTRKVIMSLLLCPIAQKSTPSQTSFQLQFHQGSSCREYTFPPFAGANGKDINAPQGKAMIFAIDLRYTFYNSWTCSRCSRPRRKGKTRRDKCVLHRYWGFQQEEGTSNAHYRHLQAMCTLLAGLSFTDAKL